MYTIRPQTTKFGDSPMRMLRVLQRNEEIIESKYQSRTRSRQLKEEFQELKLKVFVNLIRKIKIQSVIQKIIASVKCQRILTYLNKVVMKKIRNKILVFNARFIGKKFFRSVVAKKLLLRGSTTQVRLHKLVKNGLTIFGLVAQGSKRATMLKMLKAFLLDWSCRKFI